jgi:hypothetical protein
MAIYCFALTVDDPDMMAVIDLQDICWPIKSLVRARELAKQVGVPGFWRLKPKHCI